MRIEKTKNTIRNITFGFLNKIIAILFPFFIKTIITYKLGVEYLGLGGLFNSILNVLNFAELGFGTAVVFSMYKPIAEDDKDKICAILNFYKKIYRVIAMVVFLVGLAIMPFLKFLIKADVPHDINIYILFGVYMLNTVFEYCFGAYRASLLYAHQQASVQSIISALVHIVSYTLQIVVLVAFKNYYLYAIILLLPTIFNNVFVNKITKKMYPQYVNAGQISNEEKREINNKIKGLFTHKVANVIQNSIDNISISAFLGLFTLGVYNNYYYIITAVQSFLTIIFSSMTAGIGNSIARESVEENRKLFFRILCINLILVSLCTIFLFSLYQPFMQIWMRYDESKMLSLRVVILLSILFFVSNIRNTGGVFRDALGTWDKDKIRPIAISVVNLTGTLISAYFGSLEGIVLSTIIAFMFSIPWEIHILDKCYFKTNMKKQLSMMIYSFIPTIIACTLSYYACDFLSGGVLNFIIRGAITFLIAAVILAITFLPVKETRECVNILKNKIRGGKS